MHITRGDQEATKQGFRRRTHITISAGKSVLLLAYLESMVADIYLKYRTILLFDFKVKVLGWFGHVRTASLSKIHTCLNLETPFLYLNAHRPHFLRRYLTTAGTHGGPSHPIGITWVLMRTTVDPSTISQWLTILINRPHHGSINRLQLLGG
jgi:hypothetical protein